METILNIIITFLVIYFLYNRGYVTISFGVFLLFIGNFRNIKYCDKASFSYAYGFNRRVIKFNENKEYKFDLEYLISEGNLIIEILDKHKNIIAKLDKEHTSLNILVSAKQRYYIKARFLKCSGSYSLTWA